MAAAAAADPEAVVRLLKQSGHTVAAAESLTAGLFCAKVADIPGASAVLRGGMVVYATDLKASLVGVDGDLLDRRGPVDADVARQLAHGVRARCGADWGIALTGVAGPESQDGKPVGLVYIGLTGPGYDHVAQFDLSGDRAAIRAQCVQVGMALLCSALLDA